MDRRQFVIASAAGIPFLSFGQEPGTAPSTAAAVKDDAIMTQIGGDLMRSYTELKENPKRLDALRTFEGALRYHAAYATAANHNEMFRKALAKGIRAKGRAAFVEDVVSDTHAEHRQNTEIKKRFPRFNRDKKFADPNRPALSREKTDQVVSDILAGKGFTTALTALADLVKVVSEKLAAKEPMMQVRFRENEVDCMYAKSAVEYMSGLVGMMCALAALQPEIFAAACAVGGMELAVLEIIAWIACMWI